MCFCFKVFRIRSIRNCAVYPFRNEDDEDDIYKGKKKLLQKLTKQAEAIFYWFILNIYYHEFCLILLSRVADGGLLKQI